MNDKSLKAMGRPLPFPEITTPTELIAYLDSSERLKNREFLYHYTTIGNAIAIFKSKTWHLGNPKNMNDVVEYRNGDPQRWNNIFFASFMTENKESIAMWSMYVQPWKDGVKIAIPIQTMKEWIKSIDKILEVSPDYKLTGNSIPINEHNTIRISSVAYSNATSCDLNSKSETLIWSTTKNEKIPNSQHISELTGYIKDDAWEYEKEVRLKAEFENTYGFTRVAVEIPDAVLNAITIYSGPLFEGILPNRMAHELGKIYHTDQSLFTGKLNIKTICDNCQYKE